jgi:hypothetical protein
MLTGTGPDDEDLHSPKRLAVAAEGEGEPNRVSEKERYRAHSVPLSCTLVPKEHYSHSMVPGGLEVMSKTTRLTPVTSLVIRFEIFASTS